MSPVKGFVSQLERGLKVEMTVLSCKRDAKSPALCIPLTTAIGGSSLGHMHGTC